MPRSQSIDISNQFMLKSMENDFSDHNKTTLPKFNRDTSEKIIMKDNRSILLDLHRKSHQRTTKLGPLKESGRLSYKTRD
jgi:hypothetical protein